MESPAQVVLSPEWTAAPSRLQQRMQDLCGRVEGCRQRLQAQDRSVREVCRGALELQAQAAALRARLEDMSRRLQDLGVGVAAASAAATVPPPAPQSVPDREPGKGLLQCLPYVLIVAGGIGYGWTSHAKESLPSVAAQEAPVLPPEPAVAAGPESEALGLVYEYRLPGTDQNMFDLIGSQEEALGPSPWDIECDEDLRCDVSFTPRGLPESEPLYGFAVDLGAGMVTPSDETVARLLSSGAALDKSRNRG
ncbi:MAG: hypothetical protein HY926_09935 [Elusimicrobia bacterium]|nr:hypothetical protein [Elusimicrobiota bacterium]